MELLRSRTSNRTDGGEGMASRGEGRGTRSIKTVRIVCMYGVYRSLLRLL